MGLIVLQLVLILLALEYRMGSRDWRGNSERNPRQFSSLSHCIRGSSIHTFIYSTHLLSARYGKHQENSNGKSLLHRAFVLVEANSKEGPLVISAAQKLRHHDG